MSLVSGYTTNYKLAILNFDFPRWGDEHNKNLTTIDTLLKLISGLPGLKGSWLNSTLYLVGDRVIDLDLGGIYICKTQHTSPSTGTFSADRTANPTRWEAALKLPNYRGNWTTGQTYNDAEIVVVNTHDWYYCIKPHTSGTFATDLANGNWTVLATLKTSVDAAAASASSASSSASAASSSASAAAGSASAASTSASNASASASAAAGSASTATTQASNASSSASAAAGSASAAATSASNAATSASNAATSFDDFDDRYLGSKSSDPTLDNDGNALLTGALYWNTTSNVMRVRTAAPAWVDVAPTTASLNARYVRYDATQTLTGAQIKQTADNLALADVLGQNRIINGGFQFWQRGTSFSTDAVYGPDRYIMTFVGGTFTVSRQSFGLGDVLGSGITPNFFARLSVTGQSAAGNRAILVQRIENIRSYSGQQITLSFWARRSSGSGNLAVEMVQQPGTGGTPSSPVFTFLGTVNLTGVWARYTLTVTLPSVSGLILGTNGDDHLALIFWASGGSNFSGRIGALGAQTIDVDLWGLMINRGPTALEYIERPLPVELMLCQRYCTKSYDINTAPGTPTAVGVQQWYASGTSSFHQLSVPLPVRMRAAPTLTIYNPNSGATGSLRETVTPSDIAAATDMISETTIRVRSAGVSATNTFLGFHYLAVAEL